MGLKFAQTFKYVGNDYWKWSVWLDGPVGDLDRVKKVVYTLHHTFPDPVRTVTNRKSNFRLSSSGWGTFRIFASLYDKRGRKSILTHDLYLAYPENASGKKA
jgi:transcription initiation factor IIF auxiliary subunit